MWCVYSTGTEQHNFTAIRLQGNLFGMETPLSLITCHAAAVYNLEEEPGLCPLADLGHQPHGVVLAG